MDNTFGYIEDTDSSLQTKSSSTKFGMNTCTMNKIEYSPEGEFAESVSIELSVGGSVAYRTYYNPTQVFVNGIRYEKGTEEFKAGYPKEVNQKLACFIHMARALGVSVEELKGAVATASNFKEYAEAVIGTLPEDYTSKKLHVFLQWQWTIKQGKTQTFPEIPDNMKGGAYMAPYTAPVGEWKPVTINGKFKYEDEAGNFHTFERDEGFMSSHKAIQQFATTQKSGETGTANPLPMATAGSTKAWS